MTNAQGKDRQGKPAMSNTTIRILTAMGFIPVLYIIFNGGMLAAAVCLIFGAMMAREIIHITGVKILSPMGASYFVMLVLPSVMLITPQALHPAVPPSYLLGMAMLGLAFISKDISTKLITVALAACIFALVNIVLMGDGIKWLILAVGSVVAADSAAYFGGRAIGGAKLAPMISPSKTWSGAICGVTAGGIAGYGIGLFIGFSPSVSILVGLVIADLSIGGDLLESWFKRRHNVKDSGHILPGHGGFLDRFDGYLFVLPMLYLALLNGLNVYGAPHGG